MSSLSIPRNGPTLKRTLRYRALFHPHAAHVCPRCNEKRFSRTSNLYRHMRTCKGAGSFTVQGASPTATAPRNHYEEHLLMSSARGQSAPSSAERLLSTPGSVSYSPPPAGQRDYHNETGGHVSGAAPDLSWARNSLPVYSSPRRDTLQSLPRGAEYQSYQSSTPSAPSSSSPLGEYHPFPISRRVYFPNPLPGRPDLSSYSDSPPSTPGSSYASEPRHTHSPLLPLSQLSLDSSISVGQTQGHGAGAFTRHEAVASPNPWRSTGEISSFDSANNRNSEALGRINSAQAQYQHQRPPPSTHPPRPTVLIPASYPPPSYHPYQQQQPQQTRSHPSYNSAPALGSTYPISGVEPDRDDYPVSPTPRYSPYASPAYRHLISEDRNSDNSTREASGSPYQPEGGLLRLNGNHGGGTQMPGRDFLQHNVYLPHADSTPSPALSEWGQGCADETPGNAFYDRGSDQTRLSQRSGWIGSPPISGSPFYTPPAATLLNGNGGATPNYPPPTPTPYQNGAPWSGQHAAADNNSTHGDALWDVYVDAG